MYICIYIIKIILRNKIYYDKLLYIHFIRRKKQKKSILSTFLLRKNILLPNMQKNHH